MAKFYKAINLNRQHKGAEIFTEKGWESIQGIEDLKKIYQLQGECDAAGTLLTDLKKNNFMPEKATEKPEEKPIDPELLSESLPESGPTMQTFEEQNHTINGEEKTTGGTGNNTAGKPNTGSKSGKGAGSSKKQAADLAGKGK